MTRAVRWVLDRRVLLQAGVAGAVATLAGCAIGSHDTTVDVLVVGAGFSGLAAARRLHERGLTCRVLEARDRVGGRIAGAELAAVQVDRGGMWVTAAQSNVMQLIRELGLETYPTHLAGNGIALSEGRRMLFDGEHAMAILAPQSQRVVMEAFAAIEEIASQIDVCAPWSTARATEWDDLTLAAWIAQRSRSTEVRRSFDVLARTILAARSSEVSLLFFAYYIKAGGGLAVQTSAGPGGSQHLLVRGGLHQVASRLAERMAGVIRFNEPVIAIETDDDQAKVLTRNATHRSRRVIVAVPPSLAGRIAYSPALPAQRDAWTQRMPMGSVIKAWVAYDRPFWREQGLNGFILSASHGFSLAYDVTPPGGGPGLLAGFFDSTEARAWSARSRDERRSEVLRCLRDAFGSQAQTSVDYLETDWTNEQWSRGCFGAYATPGVLSRLGSAARTPIGRLHWAGTESASEWTGHVEGAIRAGRRAADEVADTLSSRGSEPRKNKVG